MRASSSLGPAMSTQVGVQGSRAAPERGASYAGPAPEAEGTYGGAAEGPGAGQGGSARADAVEEQGEHSLLEHRRAGGIRDPHIGDRLHQ